MTRGRKKQAKTLSADQIRMALERADTTLHPERDRVMVLLSFAMGLRAQEISGLEWRRHLLDAQGRFTGQIWISGDIGKYGRERKLTIADKELMEAFTQLWAKTGGREERVIYSPRKDKIGLSPNSVAKWFERFYDEMGFDGCSSHSGRRTFGTGLSRRLHVSGQSLRDLQRLMGHSHLSTTEGYLDMSPNDRDLLVTATMGA